MKDGNELLQGMRQFTGSECLFRHALTRRFTYTEGVQFFAQNAGGGAYWLLDILATEPAIRDLVLGEGEDCGFAFVKLRVTGHTAMLVVEDGNGVLKFGRHIDLTDCPPHPTSTDEPDGFWKFYIEPNRLGDGTVVMTMMLTRER
jgi:hypothetical protein